MTSNEIEREATQVGEIDWKAEAEFWKRKYLEAMMHNAQIVAALSRPMFRREVSESRSPGQPATSNGHSTAVAGKVN